MAKLTYLDALLKTIFAVAGVDYPSTGRVNFRAGSGITLKGETLGDTTHIEIEADGTPTGEFLPRDGSLPMTGALDLDGNIITNAGAINGVQLRSDGASDQSLRGDGQYHHVPDPIPPLESIPDGYTLTAVGEVATWAAPSGGGDVNRVQVSKSANGKIELADWGGAVSAELVVTWTGGNGNLYFASDIPDLAHISVVNPSGSATIIAFRPDDANVQIIPYDQRSALNPSNQSVGNMAAVQIRAVKSGSTVRCLIQSGESVIGSRSMIPGGIDGAAGPDHIRMSGRALVAKTTAATGAAISMVVDTHCYPGRAGADLKGDLPIYSRLNQGASNSKVTINAAWLDTRANPITTIFQAYNGPGDPVDLELGSLTGPSAYEGKIVRLVQLGDMPWKVITASGVTLEYEAGKEPQTRGKNTYIDLIKYGSGQTWVAVGDLKDL